MTKAIAINPAPRKTKSKARTNQRGATVAKPRSKRQSKSRAKPNPKAPAPRRNQAFKITPADARNLGMNAAGGAVGGMATGYLDEMKPEALEMVPTELLTVGVALLVAAMSKAPAAKAISAGMIGYAAGSMVEKWTAEFAAENGKDNGNDNGKKSGETAAGGSTGALYGVSNPYNRLSANPLHQRTNVGALISVI